MELASDVFVCQRCGACCRVPGFVRLTDEDVDALAGALGLSVDAFIEAYTDLSPTRSGLVLKGEPNAPCRFLTAENLCQVHMARPQQCRDYPERWRSADIEAVCLAERMRRQAE
jgi:Fe-S-cluster containining protein